MNILKPIAIAFLLPATFVTSAFNKAIETKLNPQALHILSQDTLSWNAPLPFDDKVLVGELKNGFKYYIRRNVEPEKRVTMYLGVKVGSVFEKEEELGLAHFLEHMNFNGLKHFPKNDLVNYLQKAGVAFGSDLNAYTGFDETVYQLPIPTDDPEVLKNGLQIMRDWAQDALLDAEEIDKERGIVLEEMRGRRGANQRLQDKFLPILLNGSIYSKRLPIGTEDIITNFKPEVIREFHKRWYRPDLQSIIIVGDIDEKEMEKEVIRLFSDMRVNKNIEKAPKHKVDLINKNQFLVVTDPELTSTSIQIVSKFHEEDLKTIGDFRKALLNNVFSQVINFRIHELSQLPNSPFNGAAIGISDFYGGLDNFYIYTGAKPGKLEEAFKTTLTELERINKFGITKSEFDRAITAIAKSNETSYIERDKKKSDSYVNSYLNHFLKGKPALGNEDYYKITKQLLPTLTLKEAENVGKNYYKSTDRDILVFAPEKDKETMPDEGVVNQWIADVASSNLTAYEDKTSDLPLLAKQPIKGAIKSEKSLADIEGKELILSNGVKVILKPTTFKNDQIIISSFSPGGSSLYADADYFNASNASGIVSSSGVGQLTSTELSKSLTGKNVDVNPFIGERSEGINASSDKEGLKTAFELIYAYFTAPRLDEDIFQSIISRTLSSMQNREDNPLFVFNDAQNKTLYGNNIRRNYATIGDIENLNKERILSIFKDRFADASDFTFTIVGSFTEEEIKPYLEEYIASLPNLNRKETAKNLGIIEPKNGVEKIVNKGKEQKANVSLKYFVDYTYNIDENINIDALESILNIKLIERLREDESGVYNVGAGANYRKYPIERLVFGVGFGTSVDKYKSLINSVIDEVNKIKTDGPTSVDLEKFKAEKKRQFELDIKENGYWLGYISGKLQNNEDLASVQKYLNQLDNVTIEGVKAVAKKYLKEENLFKFILLPDEVK